MLYDKDFDLVNSLNNGMKFLKPPSQVVWGRHDTAVLTPQCLRRPGNPAVPASKDFPQTNRQWH